MTPARMTAAAGVVRAQSAVAVEMRTAPRGLLAPDIAAAKAHPQGHVVGTTPARTRICAVAALLLVATTSKAAARAATGQWAGPGRSRRIGPRGGAVRTARIGPRGTEVQIARIAPPGVAGRTATTVPP